MTDQALDNLAHRVILDAARLEYGSLIEELPEHDFSPEFEKKMKKLLRQGRHPVRYRTLRAAACLLLVLFLSGCAVLAISPEFREVFAGWVREIHDNYFLYEFFGNGEREAVSEEDVLYQPAYVPAGYRIECRTVLTGGVVTIGYINDQTNDIAVFTCFSDTSSAVLQVSGENEIICRQVRVNGLSADLYLDSEEGEANVIVWVDEQNGAAFRISGVLSGEELTRMAESVRAVPRDVSFRPSWLPEGYCETSARESPVKGDQVPKGLDAGKSVLTYEDGKGGVLTITCAQVYELTDLRPNRCEADAVSVLVGENRAFLFQERTGTRHLVWADGESGVFFWLSGPFAGEELIRIGEGMRTAPQEGMFYPSWLPEGYYDVTTDDLRRQRILRYEDGKGGLLTILCPSDFDTRSLMLAGEADLISVFVGENPADLYLDRIPGNASNLVWVDRDTGILFWISAPLTSEELIKVAESVEAVNLVYSLGWVPEGYEWFDSHCDIPEIIKYRNQDGDMLLLSINKGNESIKLQVQPAEGDLYKQISVSGVPADLYLNTIGGNSILIWMDEEDGLVFVLNGPLTEEELIQVAEHVKKSVVRTAPHRPGWIPEGYVCHGYGSGGASFEIRYDRDGSESIWFRYGENSELQEELHEELKDLTPKSIQMNGQPALLYTDVDSNQHLIWSGTKLGSDYWLSGPLDIEELIQIAMSVGKTQE